MYDANLGRFCSRDPIGYQNGTLNLCAYVRGRPTTRSDSLGLTDHGDIVPTDPSKCKIGIECTAALGVFPRLGRHCGVVTGAIDGNGTFVKKHYHAIGIFAPPGRGGCEILNQQGGTDTPGNYSTQSLGEFPKAVCDCLDQSQSRINLFMQSGNDNYSAVPLTSCFLNKPQCNSNYSANCLLRGCGLFFNTSKNIPGWGFRMQRCTWRTDVKCFGKLIDCRCWNWENVDNGICEPIYKSGVPIETGIF
jgi:hypothetical protein